MALVDDLADQLAEDTLAAMDRIGDDRFYVEVAKELAAASTTLEEAFLTSIRVRLAERRARRFVDARLRQADTDAPGRGG